MLNRRAILISAFAAIVTSLGLAMARYPDSALSHAELGARDVQARFGRTVTPNPKLIFLAIDIDSTNLDAKTDLEGLFEIKDGTTLEGRALSAMSERWPWPRRVYGHILDRLVAAGAKAVVFDLNFPTASAEDENDAAFREALQRHADHTVIGSNFITASPGERSTLGATLTLPTPALIPQTKTPDHRVGFVNFWPDADGTVRQAQFRTSFAQFIGAAGDLGEAQYPSLAARTAEKFGRADAIPPGSESHLFRYTAGPLEGFPPHSIFEIFVPEYWQRNFQSGKVFDGAIVMVGAFGNWQHDEHVTPFGTMPGPELQLNVINALLRGEFIRELSGPATLGLWLLACAIGALASISFRAPVWRVGGLVAISGCWAFAQLQLFDRLNFVGPIVGPMLVIALTGFISIVYDLGVAGAEQLRLRRSLGERKREQEILERTNQELERRVAARTKDLTQANENLTGLLSEKDVLLKEVHHRVKNNLQVISSLLNLQSGYIKDPVALQVFVESRNRVRSMALIHEKLYQSQDLSRIDFEDYIKTLSNGLLAGFAGKKSAIRIEVDVEKIMLPVDAAVPCGLIVNELVTNCFKYAFAPEAGGQIRISMKRSDDAHLHLSVSDDGVGFPKDLDFRNTESLGMQLVITLSEQLEGTIHLQNGVGTTFEISFPENYKSKL